MKQFFTLLFISSLSVSSIAQSVVIDSVKNKRILTGPLSQSHIADSIWYRINYSEAVATDNEIQQLDNLIQGAKIEIYFGSWCDDSQFWVPALIGLLDKTSYIEAVDLIALDRSKKSAQAGRLKEIFDKVPTFVVWRDGKECGRIIESPEESLVKDLTKILLVSSEND